MITSHNLYYKTVHYQQIILLCICPFCVGHFLTVHTSFSVRLFGVEAYPLHHLCEENSIKHGLSCLQKHFRTIMECQNKVKLSLICTTNFKTGYFILGTLIFEFEISVRLFLPGHQYHLPFSSTRNEEFNSISLALDIEVSSSFFTSSR